MKRKITESDLGTMVGAANAGYTPDEIGVGLGVSRTTVDNHLRKVEQQTSEWLLPKAVRRAHRKARVQDAARAKWAEVKALSEAGWYGTDIARELNIHGPTTVKMYRQIRREAGYAKQTPQRFTDAEILTCIQRASKAQRIQGLSVKRYEDFRIGRVLPSGELWPTNQSASKRFGSWAKACQEAGVEPGQRASGAGTKQQYTRADCVQAIIQVSNGKMPTVTEYEQRKTQNMPSSATIRLRYGKWSAAITEAAAVR